VRLDDEVGALSLAGGRRAVWVQGLPGEALEVLAAVLKTISAASTLLVVEAGELAPRDRLRQLFEAAKTGMAVPCYPDDGAELERLIERSLEARGLAIESDAMAYLAASLGGDRLAIRSELEKLALYKADRPTPVSREDAEACIGDGVPELVDDVVMAAAGGDPPTLDRALGRCLAAGTAPVTILRAQARHLMQLYRLAGRVAAGEDAERMIDSLRPPVFWKRKAPMQAQLRLWNRERLARALELLLDAELQCMTAGLPDGPICGRALMRIAQAARASGR
jgi:DNA polymerase-3 subunit delta